jgi:hypothetical protein
MEFRPGVSAASPAPQNPQNRFQHATVLNPRTAALALLGWLGEQGRNLLHCASVTNALDRAIRPPSALLTLLISHLRKLLYLLFRALYYVMEQLLLLFSSASFGVER